MLGKLHAEQTGVSGDGDRDPSGCRRRRGVCSCESARTSATSRAGLCGALRSRARVGAF